MGISGLWSVTMVKEMPSVNGAVFLHAQAIARSSSSTIAYLSSAPVK